MATGATPITDKDVKIPAAVKARAAAADALHKQIYNTAESPATPPETPPAETPPPADPATPPETPPVDPATPPADPATPPADPAEPKNGWEHAYKSMKGRYERSQEALRIANERTSFLEQRVRELEDAPPPPAATLPPTTPVLTPKEIEDYGPDFLEVVGKKAQEIYAPVVAGLQNQIAELQSQLGNVGKTVASTARDKMKAQLSSEVANWSEINVNPDFLTWLSLPDQFSGVKRHDLLKDAWGRNDAARVLAFFKGFLAQEAADAPAAIEPDEHQDQPGKVPLETLAAPGRAKPAAGPKTPAEKPIITRPYISQFYAEVAAGKYRGREQEKLEIEQRISAAAREGRIK